MEKNRFKLWFPIMLILITANYIYNNSVEIGGKVIVFKYIVIFFNFIAWIISIVRTIREKNKFKIIPCVIITILVIAAFVIESKMLFSDFYIQILAQIGLAVFLYEIIDLFKIEFKLKWLDIIIGIICFFIIIIFLLNQLLTINKYKKSLNDVSKFIKSEDLSYEKFSEELNLFLGEYNDISNYTSEKMFLTPSEWYRLQYDLVAIWLDEGVRSVIKNKKTFNEYIEWVNEETDRNIDIINENEKEINKIIISSTIIWVMDITILCVIGTKNRKNNSNIIE